MAKLKAPLLSLGATGKLGGALVFFNWKGIDVVREYVVPTNPNTALQQIQRGFLRDAVATIHTAQAHATEPLTEADQVAYANLANAQGKTMTWFNMACKLYLDSMRAADNPIIYHSGDITDPNHALFDMNIAFTEVGLLTLVNGQFYFGTTRTNLIHAEVAWVNPAFVVGLTNVDLSAWAVAGEKYFVQFRPDVGDPCEGADSGIYYFWAT